MILLPHGEEFEMDRDMAIEECCAVGAALDASGGGGAAVDYGGPRLSLCFDGHY